MIFKILKLKTFKKSCIIKFKLKFLTLSKKLIFIFKAQFYEYVDQKVPKTFKLFEKHYSYVYIIHKLSLSLRLLL